MMTLTLWASVLWWQRVSRDYYCYCCWCWRLCSHPGDSRKIVGRTEGGERERLASGDPPSAPATSAACTRHLSFNYSLKRRSSPKFPNNYDVCQARNHRRSVVVAGPGPPRGPRARQINRYHPADHDRHGENALPWQRLQQQRPRWHKRWLILTRLTSILVVMPTRATLLKYRLHFNPLA